MQKPTKNNYRLFTLAVIYIMHIIIGYLTYSLAYSLVSSNNIAITRPEIQSMPSSGELWILLGMVLSLCLSVFVTIALKRYFEHKFKYKTQAGIREFVMLNLLPISFVLVVIYLIFDPLISTAIYLVFFIFLIFFQDS
jgi:hypothetical protein